MQLSFDHELGVGSLLLTVVAMGVVVALLYRQLFQSGRDRRLWKLVALRIGALALVLLLLYRPVASIERTENNHGELALLVDTSGSMSVQDDSQGRTRLEQVQQALLAHADRLSGAFDIRAYHFDARTSPLKQLSAVEALQPTGSESNLAGALRTTVASGTTSRTVAVIALTDGIDNSGRDVVAVARDLGVPVHTVAAGYRLTGGAADRDVMIESVECPDQLPLNTQARITARIEARGLKGRVARVELVERDAVIAEASVPLDDVRGLQSVELTFTPETKGRHEYTVRIPKLSGELIDQNNRHAVSAVVVDSRLRVLYVEGGIRAEYGTLVGRYLAHDPTVEYLALVQTRPGLFVQRTNIADWNEQGIPSAAEQLQSFDVFVIGDLPSQFLGDARMATIETLVSGGKGLLMLGGAHSFFGGGYAATPIGKLLPVELTDPGEAVNEPFSLKLTSAGRIHPVFAGMTDFFEASASADVPPLPTLLGCTRLDRPKPSAEVLAVHPELGNEHGPLTVLAVHRYGEGRAAAFAADTTYRWYQVMQGLKEESPYIRFWGQMLRWLAGKKETDSLAPGLFVNTDKGFYRPGDAVELEAVLVGDDGRGVDNAFVEAIVELSETDTERAPSEGRSAVVPLERSADRPGTYLGSYTPDESGLYAVTVRASANASGMRSTEIDRAELHVQVGNPSREFDRLQLDETTLQAIADASGGRYVHVARAERLFDMLVNEQQAQRILLEQRLYSPPLFWLVCIGLITTEWLLRRKYRLK